MPTNLDTRITELLTEIQNELAEADRNLARLRAIEHAMTDALTTTSAPTVTPSTRLVRVKPGPKLSLHAAVLTLLSGRGAQGMTFKEIQSTLRAKGYDIPKVRGGGGLNGVLTSAVKQHKIASSGGRGARYHIIGFMKPAEGVST